MVCEICSIEISKRDTHHFHSKSKGGGNIKWNRAKLCPNCHRLCHTGEIIIEGRFMTTEGYKIIWRRKGDKSITGHTDPDVYIYPDKE